MQVLQWAFWVNLGSSSYAPSLSVPSLQKKNKAK
jgi:hypothetical protein